MGFHESKSRLQRPSPGSDNDAFGGSDCALLTQRCPIGLYLQHAVISGQGADASTNFESRAKESFGIAAKIGYRNGGRIGIPKGGARDCTMVAAAPVRRWDTLTMRPDCRPKDDSGGIPVG
jgi:hypothetical protein